jgi:hypothetical protein
MPRPDKHPRIRVESARFSVVPTATRFPFHYGIASMTYAPHVFLAVELSLDGVTVSGLASEGLPPKWFTKDPGTTFEEDLPRMVEVLRHAASVTLAAGEAPGFFDLWQVLYRGQERWAAEQGIPPLLANLGVSLVERAVIDGLCRGLGTSFRTAVHGNVLGLRLGDVYPELAGCEPADLLPAAPLREVAVRHTVGLADPLTEGEIPDGSRVDDGLPQSLEAAVAAYGIDHFKVKVCGDLERDLRRLAALARLLGSACPDYRITLDGNEQFQDIGSFRSHWEAWHADAGVAGLLRHLVFVEQPVHRDRALGVEVGEALRSWGGAPPVVIDESDAAIGDLPRALALGCAGTSHKSCKGIVKGIANACLLERRRRLEPDVTTILSGEDLATIGPVALLQDLATMSLFGIRHVERNGHHYFRGLSGFPVAVQEEVLRRHPDLYRRHAEGFPTLDIWGGRLRIGSVVEAPFGTAVALDVSRFAPLDGA